MFREPTKQDLEVGVAVATDIFNTFNLQLQQYLNMAEGTFEKSSACIVTLLILLETTLQANIGTDEDLEAYMEAYMKRLQPWLDQLVADSEPRVIHERKGTSGN